MDREYIERETALEKVIEVKHHDPELSGVVLHRYIKEIDLKDIPAADVVEVVRCRECKYSYKDEIFGNRWCDSHLGCRKVKDDGYCYLGERKEGADNG